MSRKVLAGVTDLFFVARMEEAARRAGVDLTYASSAEDLVAQASAGIDLVVLDLDDAGIEILDTIRKLRAEPRTASIPLLGFISHVKVEVAERAKQAGCDRVVPRSRFSAQLVELLRG